jgi:hypothetical protein
MLVAEDSLISDCLYGLADRTQKQYTCYLSLFLSYVYPHLKGKPEVQASQFLGKAREPGGADWAQEQFISLLKSLRYVKPSVYKNYYKALFCFCDNHGINLQWKRIRKRHIPKGGEIANDRAPTMEEIKQILRYADYRIKPLVLVTLSSGIRIGAWKYLQWKHVTPVDKECQNLDRDNPGEVAAAKLIVYAGEPDQYLGLITPEAFHELKVWMDTRKRAGEKISDESWLMRDTFPWDSGYGAANPQRLSESGIIKILRRAVIEQGVRGKPITAPDETKRYPFKVTHGLRKFFETKAYQGGMSRTDVYFLADHQMRIDSNYVRPTEQELIRSYFKIVNHLTIYSNRQMVIKEVSDNQLLLAAQIQSKNTEIAALREQTQIMSKQLADVIEQQQQHANTFDMKFVKLLDIVKTGLVDQDRDEATMSFISGEIVKMMPRKLTTKELQKIEEYRNLTGVFIDSTDSKGS